MDCTIKSNDEKIIINDHLEGDPLLDENLDKVLNLVHEIRLLCPDKNIWLYTGYTFEQITFPLYVNKPLEPNEQKRIEIIKQCNVLVDGQCMDSQRKISLKFHGSKNQRCINIEETLKNEFSWKDIVLWTGNE